MGTSQIRVSEEAKARLEAMKREGESYADVVERLLEEQADSPLDDAIGILDDDQAEFMRERIEEGREESRELHR